MLIVNAVDKHRYQQRSSLGSGDKCQRVSAAAAGVVRARRGRRRRSCDCDTVKHVRRRTSKEGGTGEVTGDVDATGDGGGCVKAEKAKGAKGEKDEKRQRQERHEKARV